MNDMTDAVSAMESAERLARERGLRFELSFEENEPDGDGRRHYEWDATFRLAGTLEDGLHGSGPKDTAHAAVCGAILAVLNARTA